MKWKRWFACGCSHGDLADPEALKAILRFRNHWNPETCIHLGDAFDTTAFRAGARGTKDEAAPVQPDLLSGIAFLKALRPDVFLCGNHEDRLWNLMEHPNAIVSALATDIVHDIEFTCRKLKCRVVPYNYKAFVRLGDTKFLHGYLFNEQCCRDHAEAFGSCVFAHAHRAGQAYGRRWDNPLGTCVGTLMRISAATYAKARRSTLAWSQGFAWGYYSDTRTITWLHTQPQGQTEWVLPL